MRSGNLKVRQYPSLHLLRGHFLPRELPTRCGWTRRPSAVALTLCVPFLTSTIAFRLQKNGGGKNAKFALCKETFMRFEVRLVQRSCR